MNITVYLPDEIGAQAKAAELNLSRLLRDAVTDELERRATMERTLNKATTHELRLENPDGGQYIGRITATELLEETSHGVVVYLTEDERVLAYDTGNYAYELIDDPEEELRDRLDDDDYVTVMHQLGITPTIDLDL